MDQRSDGIDLSVWQRSAKDRERLLAERRDVRSALDRRQFDRPDLAWSRRAVVEAFAFPYDSSFCRNGQFRIDSWLDDGEREFGGYDLLLLWQPYPRIGIDQRNQLDFWRDMPGGLAGLRRMIGRCHDRGVRVILNHIRWDVTKPRDWRGDAQAIAQIVAASDADGLYGDTLAAFPVEFREELDKLRPGLVLETENNPPLHALAVQTDTWSQGHDPRPLTPFIQTWIEPRSMIRLVNRGAADRTGMLADALFFGHGIVVWENVFGSWNPWTAKDRAMAQRVVPLLRAHVDAFTDSNWMPWPACPAPGVYANEFTAPDRRVVTLKNTTDRDIAAVPLRLERLVQGARTFDVWNGQELAEIHGNAIGAVRNVVVPVAAGSCGCLVITATSVPEHAPPRTAHEPRRDMRLMADRDRPGTWVVTGSTGQLIEQWQRGPDDARQLVVDTGLRTRVTADALRPRPVDPASARKGLPAGMVRRPGGRFVMSVRHTVQTTEGGCYGDPQSLHHPPQYFWLPPLLMDRTEVTNSEYRRFLSESQYRPGDATSFLRHWAHGGSDEPARWTPPPGKDNHPVVWVDLDDARAYARWAGKRLPREEEWQSTAQGDDGRLWPWGDVFKPGRCNHDTDDTTAVDAFPKGACPCGVLDLAGNVWEWTESERDDGHTRYAILRGGSHFVRHAGDHPEAWGKMWYLAEGAQPNDAHAKMLLMYGGMDRCATVGFRCVVDL
jgi:formylglycine-generating enzyme required for sulfatase activity